MDKDYIKWIREEASKINSDGCSGVIDISKDCCLEHDLAYYYGRDPSSAFVVKSWSLAAKISRSEADAAFRKCNGDLMGLWRWAGVRLAGWNAWRKHRKARP